MKRRSRQPLLHRHRAHPLPRGHPLVVVDQLQIQPVVVKLRGLGHLLVVVGDAGDEAQVAVDDPANSRSAADAKDPPGLGSGSGSVPPSGSLSSDLVR